MKTQAAHRTNQQKDRPKPDASKKLSLIAGKQRKSGLKKRPVLPKGFGFVTIALADIREFQQLKELSGLSAETLASLMGTTTRTLQNKKSGKTSFDLPLTERLRKLIQLFKEGTELLRTKDQFSKWLKQPAYGLDYTIPFDLLKNPGGLDKVMDELSAIKYGDTV